MIISYPLLIGMLAGVLVLAVVGVWSFASGIDQQATWSARGALDDAERRANSPLARLDVHVRRTALGRSVSRQIIASGLRMRPSSFLLLLSGVSLATIFLIGQILGTFVGLIAAVAVGLAFFGYLRRQEARRREDFISQLPELARVLSNATSAGLAVRTAIEMAAEELDEPARTELARTAHALRIGQSFEDALIELRDRLPSKELGVLVSTLVVSSRSGGSLVTALRNISQTLEDRKETRREVKTIVGKSAMTGYLVASLGVFMLFGLNFLFPGSVEAMSQETVGRIILIFSLGAFTLAVLIIRKITRIDV